MTKGDPNKNPKDRASVDHFFPKSEGGDSFNESNLVVSCIECNHQKRSYFRYVSNIRENGCVRESKLKRLEEYALSNGFHMWISPFKPEEEMTA